MHSDQIELPVGTVRRLVDDQFPRWNGLPIERVHSSGTVNAVFRLGDRLSARFPLQAGDPVSVRRWLESEAEAARELLGRTPFATPEPVALGEPGAGYPLPWAVQAWLPGVTATAADPGASVGFAHDLARFIHAVRGIDTDGRTFSGQGRGGDLRTHDTWMQTCLRRSHGLLDVDALRLIWHEFRELPRTATSDVMTHSDLVPGNVLVAADGRLAGIIDVGGLGPADPALDLVGGWHLLEAEPRRAFRDDLASDDFEWERGKAWAFVQAMGLVWYYADSNVPMSQLGRRTLHRLMTDA